MCAGPRSPGRPRGVRSSGSGGGQRGEPGARGGAGSSRNLRSHRRRGDAIAGCRREFERAAFSYRANAGSWTCCQNAEDRASRVAILAVRRPVHAWQRRCALSFAACTLEHSHGLTACRAPQRCHCPPPCCLRCPTPWATALLFTHRAAHRLRGARGGADGMCGSTCRTIVDPGRYFGFRRGRRFTYYLSEITRRVRYFTGTSEELLPTSYLTHDYHGMHTTCAVCAARNLARASVTLARTH